MDWSHVNFDWNQARAFLATVEEGSLSAAARVLGQTQPTLGRQVAALETAWGVVLFERVGSRLELTPAGRDMLVHVRRMRDAAQAVSLSAAGHSDAVEGVLRITASDVFSAYLMPDIVRSILEVAPRLVIDVVADNDVTDLQRRDADIAIRHVRPDQPELFARLIGETEARIYGSDAYLAQRGTPQTADDMAHHDLVGIGDTDVLVSYMVAYGLPVSAANVRVGSRNGIVAWEMVRQGLGLAPMATRVGELTQGVQPVLTDLAPMPFPVWLTTHRELQSSARIRLVFDMMAEHLSGGLVRR